MSFLNALAADVAKVRKALVAGLAVLAAISAVNGVPGNVQGYLNDAFAVLAAFGVTYTVPNKA